MEQSNITGMIVTGSAALIGLIVMVIKCLKPINELNINIVKLTGTIERLIENDKKQDIKIEKNNEQIDSLIVKSENHEQRIKILERKG